MALQSTGSARDKLAAGTTAQRPSLGSSDMGSIRYNSSTKKMEYWDGTKWVKIMIDTVIGNGQINVSAGNGISVSGSNGTANQTGNTTRTVTADMTYINNHVGNGQINVNAGTGIKVSGTNAKANQSTNTTRTVAFDTTWGDARYALASGGGGGAKVWCTYDGGGNIKRQSGGITNKENHSTANYLKYYNLKTSVGTDAAVLVSGPMTDKGNHGRMKTNTKMLLKYDNSAHSVNTGGTGEPELNKTGGFAIFA